MAKDPIFYLYPQEGGHGDQGLTPLDRGEEARLLVGGEEGGAEPQPPNPRHRLPPPPPAARPGADRGRSVGVAVRRLAEGLPERGPAVGIAAAGHTIIGGDSSARSTRTAGMRMPCRVYVIPTFRLRWKTLSLLWIRERCTVLID